MKYKYIIININSISEGRHRITKRATTFVPSQHNKPFEGKISDTKLFSLKHRRVYRDNIEGKISLNIFIFCRYTGISLKV